MEILKEAVLHDTFDTSWEGALYQYYLMAPLYCAVADSPVVNVAPSLRESRVNLASSWL